jgi:DNA-binding beta-propeller fold protein YncE
MNRRAFLLALAPTLACKGPVAARFHVFVANQESRSVVAVDLLAFRVIREIKIDGAPTAILSHPRRPKIYVLTPRTGTVHEIDPVSFAVGRKARVAASAISMRLAPDGKSLWILSREARALIQLDLDRFQTGARIKLSAEPEDFDVSAERAAISFPKGAGFAIAGLSSGRVEPLVSSGPGAQTIRFFHSGAQLLCGNRGNRTVTVFDVEKGRVIAHLPVAVDPENFCYKASDDGQLYVTGAGMDAVVVIYPYQSYVYETRLVGRSPGAMAVSSSPEYLFVAGAESGNVSVMDSAGKIVAVVAVGVEPRHIAVTPDNRFALALNSRSGDMAVIRIGAFVDRRSKKTSPMAVFTMIPVGANPVSAAIRPV